MRRPVLYSRWMLAWYLPLVALVLSFVVGVIGRVAWQDLRLVAHRFSVGVFFSPAAYLHFSALLASVFLPLQLLLAIPIHFNEKMPSYPRRYRLAFGLVFLIVASAVVLQFVIWGTFPLEADASHQIHLRLIPFIPWPDRPF